MESTGPTADAGTTSPFSPIDEILDELRQGNLIILVDDEDRENEGDLVCRPVHNARKSEISCSATVAERSACR